MSYYCKRCGQEVLSSNHLCPQAAQNNDSVLYKNLLVGNVRPFDGSISNKIINLEKSANLAGEIIATLVVNIENGYLPKELEPIVNNWRDKLQKYSER